MTVKGVGKPQSVVSGAGLAATVVAAAPVMAATAADSAAPREVTAAELAQATTYVVAVES